MELKGNDLVGAYQLGKYDGIGTAEGIMASVISKAVVKGISRDAFNILDAMRKEFKEECARYRADINTPVTEEQKQELLKNTI